MYTWRVSSSYTNSTAFDIASAVDITHAELQSSPIDQFISKNQELNSLLLDPNRFGNKVNDLTTRRKLSRTAARELTNTLSDVTIISPVLANLVLLGHISAVESYFRSIFKKLILLDKATQKMCYSKTLSYSAVLFHDKESLPDALLEFISFSSKKNIEDTLKDFFGVKGAFPPSLPVILDEFSKVCQMRHSIVHKFGTVGINNIRHDVAGHKAILNKQIRNNFTSIQEISQICRNVVNEINQILWQNIMTRLIADFTNNRWIKKNDVVWSWVWSRDRVLYTKYFNLFFSNISHPPNINVRDAYRNYQITYQSLN